MAGSAITSVVAFDASSASIATRTSGVTFNSEATARSASSIGSTTRKPLPLTTIFTPPASCSQIVTWDGNNLWQYGTNQTGGECYPPNFHKIFNSFYNPGICPDAWTSAGTLPHSAGHDAMCCPKGYFLSAHLGYVCASIFTNTLASVYFTSTLGDDPIPSGASFTTFDASGGVGTVIADVIQVQWQDKDREVVSLMAQKTATTTTSAQVGAGITSPTPSPTATATAGSQSATGSSGISTGAKIGIGVAVPIIVLALLAIAAMFFLRKRKQRAANRHEPPIEVESKEVESKKVHELSPQDYKPVDKPWNQRFDHLAAQPPQEMDATQLNELPADGPVHEIAGQQLQRGSTYKSGSPHGQSPSSPQTPRRGPLR